MILAGDIGGTNTRLALFDASGQPRNIREFPSQRHAALEEIISEYLAHHADTTAEAIERACFGVAGPVAHVDGRLVSRITNLTWTIDQASLGKLLGIAPAHIGIINDLAANATGIEALGPDQFLVLQEGQPSEKANRAIISAGTGLGVAGLQFDGAFYRPVPSEGGHASFGPRTDQQIDLLRYLRDQEREIFNGHVSWERVLSGPGLYHLFDFLRARNQHEQKLNLPPGLKPGEAARLVSKAGLDGSCPRSVAALDLFVDLYGSAAGNLALQFIALGGLYLGGGIAPKIAAKLGGPAFMTAFLEKGPLKTRVLDKVPVRVILDEHTALRGAARYARVMMGAA